jgi:hypothetical protein
MSFGFNAEEQLRQLIEKQPFLAESGIKIDLYGVILDYLATSGYGLEELLIRYGHLYGVLFPTGHEIPAETQTLLQVLLKDSSARSSVRIAAKRHDWKSLTVAIDEIDRAGKARASAKSSLETDKLAKHRVEFVIWQLSDLHFGSLNTLAKDARTIAKALAKITREKPEFSPRFVVVSGDVSSCASESEFNEFLEFTKFLSEEIWGGERPWRFLVVPGNHETTWFDDGTADHLEKFRKFIAKSNIVVTPFWEGRPSYTDNLGRVSVQPYSGRDKDSIPPFVLVHDKEVDLRFLLLVSPYYSGNVPKPARKILSDIRKLKNKDYLTKLLRQDTGSFSEGYISSIDSSVWTPSDSPGLENTTTIAVTHHNPYQYGSEICQSPDAPLLLQTLANKGIFLILHGHTHFIENHAIRRPVIPGQAYPIPCPTLSGLPYSRGSTNGFMLHMFGPAGTGRHVTSVQWMINHLGEFDRSSEHLRARYRFVVDKDRLRVRHV